MTLENIVKSIEKRPELKYFTQMEVEYFKTILSSDLTNTAVCERTIFSDEAWVLSQEFPDSHRLKYQEMKVFFGEKFQIAPKNVCLIGSGKLGFSLNPESNYRGFLPEKSDLDVVLVSSALFEQYWSILLNAHYSWNIRLSTGHQNKVFRRFVSFKPFKEDSIEEIRKLNIAMGEVQRDFFVNFNISNTINYRIYRDWEAVNQYHCNGIEALRRGL